ncbi:hypothetical protein ACMXYQ_08385 [Neptuniibacter sp. PT34_22]|uniref:hypothetical protein n=1 Tax=Neptuniibacter sp. PT34_22 TaxID=3398205 RepID=UPI0039F4B1B7
MNLGHPSLDQVYEERSYPDGTIYFSDDHIVLIHRSHLRWLVPLFVSTLTITLWKFEYGIGLLLLSLYLFYQQMKLNPWFDKRTAIFKNGDIKALSICNNFKIRRPLGKIKEIEVSDLISRTESAEPYYILYVVGELRKFEVLSGNSCDSMNISKPQKDLELFFDCPHQENTDSFDIPATYRKSIWDT